MRVAVSGAGIGGLVAALSLARLGHTVTVFERAPELRAVGAGLQLSPNALDVLDRLGVARKLMTNGVAADAVTLRDGRSGRPLGTVPVTAADGRGYLSLLRSDLQDALLAALRAEDAIRLRLGFAAEDLQRDADGWRLEDAGGEERFDLLVAADGVRSAIRHRLDGARPHDSGSVALRLRVEQRAPAGIQAWLGFRRHAVAYPVAGGRETNLVLIVRSADADTPAARLFGSWDERLRQLIQTSETLGTWPLLRHQPLWRGERLALVGDAAHAMLPYAAQGAAMAIEDGWVLAACIGRTRGIEEALADYERRRAPRVNRVLGRVAFHRLVYHLPRPLSWGRDAVLSATPPDRLGAQLSWLYDWRAPDLS